jgi:hypothetical protein
MFGSMDQVRCCRSYVVMQWLPTAALRTRQEADFMSLEASPLCAALMLSISVARVARCLVVVSCSVQGH